MKADTLKKEFIPKYLSVGSDKFYRFLLAYAVNKMVYIQKGEYKGISPDLELLDYHDQFIILFRRENDDAYLDISKLFRKAAHHVYRALLKKGLTDTNNKFLNLV